MLDHSYTEFLKKNLNELETPSYLFSAEKAKINYTKLKKELGTQLIVSVKANPCSDLLQRISHITMDGYEVASIKELQIVASPSAKIYANSPAMDADFLRAVIALKAIIIIDNLPTIELLESNLNGKKLEPLILRLNNSILNRCIFNKKEIHEDHFGLDWEELTEAIRKIHLLNQKINGIHIFNGSNSFSNTASKTVDIIVQLIPEFEKLLGYQIEFINLGGGFSSNFEALDFKNYKEKLRLLPGYLTVAHESGRGIFASAGIFITRVLNTKIIKEKIIVVCDGGIAQNFLLARTENIIRNYQIPIIIKLSNQQKKSELPLIFVGNTCSQNDIISKCQPGSILPEIGDLCVFENCGAYNHTYTVSNFLNLKNATLYVS